MKFNEYNKKRILDIYLNKKITGILFLFFVVLQLYAQHDFRPGYIIFLNNDSITGQIDYKRPGKNSQICVFRKNSKEKYTTYTPDQIKAYGFFGLSHYVSRIVQIDSLHQTAVFLENLVKGKINLYSLNSNGRMHFYIEREFFGFTELPYFEYIKNVNGYDRLFRTVVHKEILKHYMEDCQGIDESINSISKPEEVPLINLFRKFHQLNFSNENDIVYRKKTSYLNMSILPSFKIQVNEKEFSGSKYYQYGGFLVMINTKDNERLIFKTGVLLSFNNKQAEKVNIVQIPFRIVYLYPAYRLKPFIGLGVNSSYIFNYSKTTASYKSAIKYYDVSAELGLIYNFNNRLSAYTELDFNLTTNTGSIVLIKTEGIYRTYSLQFGCKFQLF